MDKIIDRKGLKLGIKNGFGFSEFEEKYGANKESLTESVFILYKNNKETAEELLREITRNEKKNEKARSREPLTEYKGVPIEDIKRMSMDEFMEFENGGADSEKGIPEKVLLEDEICNLEETVAFYESERKRWLTKHYASSREMNKLEEDLKNLREKFVSIKSKYGAIAERDSSFIKKADEALENLRESKDLLNTKRQRLEELNKIAICAYADGTIAPLDESIEVVLDDSGFDGLYLELVKRDECQDLKAREILVLARLLKIVEKSAFAIEVVCDTVEMETAYHALVN